MNVALTIDEKAISSDEIYALLVKQGMLPQLAKEIIIEQAIASIECTPEEQIAARNQIYQQQQINTQAQVKQWLQQKGLTLEQLDELAIKSLKLAKFKQAMWGDGLQSYFFQNKQNLDSVIYYLIRTQDRGIAQEIYFRLQNNEASFAELASQYSQGIEAKTGGLIGPVELKTLNSQVALALRHSRPGQLLPPLVVKDWLVILRLERLISAQFDQPMQEKLLDEFFRSWLEQQFQQRVSILSEKTICKVNIAAPTTLLTQK